MIARCVCWVCSPLFKSYIIMKKNNGNTLFLQNLLRVERLKNPKLVILIVVFNKGTREYFFIFSSIRNVLKTCLLCWVLIIWYDFVLSSIKNGLFITELISNLVYDTDGPRYPWFRLYADRKQGKPQKPWKLHKMSPKRRFWNPRNETFINRNKYG